MGKFSFAWKEDASVGSGRTTVWVHAGSSIVFKYHGSRQPSITGTGSMPSPSPRTPPPVSTLFTSLTEAMAATGWIDLPESARLAS